MLALLPHLVGTMRDELETSHDPSYLEFVERITSSFSEAIGSTIWNADFFRYIPKQISALRTKLAQLKA